MKICKKAQLQMNRKLDGLLAPSEDAALQEHLSACPNCRAVWEQLCTLRQCLQEPTPTPPELHGAIMAKLAWTQQEPEQKRPARSGARRKKWIPALAGAAACGVLVLGAVRLGLFRGASSADNLSWNTGMAMAPSAAQQNESNSFSAGADGLWTEELDALSPEASEPADAPEAPKTEASPAEDLKEKSSTEDWGADYLAQGPKSALPQWIAALLQTVEKDGVSRDGLELEPEQLETFMEALSQRGFTIQALRELPAEGSVHILFLWE